jgi:hypothetical protein
VGFLKLYQVYLWCATLCFDILMRFFFKNKKYLSESRQKQFDREPLQVRDDVVSDNCIKVHPKFTYFLHRHPFAACTSLGLHRWHKTDDLVKSLCRCNLTNGEDVALKKWCCLREDVPFYYCLSAFNDAKNLVLGRRCLWRQIAWEDLRCGSTISDVKRRFN